MRYLALLRGINVGGKGIIKMDALRAMLESAGFTDVKTYIQSGNVVFDAPKAKTDAIAGSIERALKKGTGEPIRALVMDAAKLGKIVDAAPKGYGKEPGKHKYDVAFMFPPSTAKEAAAQFTVKEGIDDVTAGPHAVYSRRLTAKLTKSGLSRITQKPVYKDMTIRNWNTVTKLLAMMRE